MTYELWEAPYLGSSEGQYIGISKELLWVFGPVDAIILQEVHFWCRFNAGDKTGRRSKTHLHEGHWWMRRTQEEWASLLKLSDKSARKHLSLLAEPGPLVSAVWNRQGNDQTRWYRIDYERLEAILAANPIPDGR